MRRSLSSGVPFLPLAVALSARLAAQGGAAPTTLNSGALFLLFPVGAEAVGLGQTAVSLDGHGEAAFWNPAGLATMGTAEFGLHTANLAAGNTNALTAFFPKRGIGVIGGAVYLVDYGDQDVNDSSGLTLARIAPRNVEFLASFATEFTHSFAFGVTYKLVQFRVDCSGDCRNLPAGGGTTHAIDAGAHFTVGANDALKIGVAVRNIGFKLQVNNRDQADPLPARLVVGGIYQVNLRPLAEGDTHHFDVKVAADLDSPWGEVGNPDMRLGLDVGYEQLLRLRGGYAFAREGLRGPSVGVGVHTGSIGVDFARPFLQGSDLVVPNPTFVSFRVDF